MDDEPAPVRDDNLALRAAGAACYVVFLAGMAVTVTGGGLRGVSVDSPAWRVLVFGIGLLGIGLMVVAHGRQRVRA